jgi:hypothetical protein
VTSTAGDGVLAVADPAVSGGHLVNGDFVMPQALQVNATSVTGSGGAYAPVVGSMNPTNLLTYTSPVSNDQVTIRFKQLVAANDALGTGSYIKILTFTLSTSQP